MSQHSAPTRSADILPFPASLPKALLLLRGVTSHITKLPSNPHPGGVIFRKSPTNTLGTYLSTWGASWTGPREAAWSGAGRWCPVHVLDHSHPSSCQNDAIYSERLGGGQGKIQDPLPDFGVKFHHELPGSHQAGGAASLALPESLILTPKPHPSWRHASRWLAC